VSPGSADIDFIHIDAEDISAEQAFMVIDLSDTTNWPHSNTGHIDVVFLSGSVDPDSTYAGDIALGFLTNVDATNGDFNGLFELHLEKKTAPLTFTLPIPFGGMPLETGHYFGPITADSTLFQTDVNLTGPDGNANYPSGNGDLVLIIGRTAGAVDVGLTIGYVTKA
jgi:hypothetical protein